MSKRAALLALLCALVGLGASASAAYTHYHMLYDPSYRSFCDVNETISCTQVYQSRFSTVRGVPVAIFGAMWFAVAALLSVSGLTARQSVRESVPGYLFALSTLALAVVLYLGYASFFLLKAVCLLCLTTYAAVIGLFLITELERFMATAPRTPLVIPAGGAKVLVVKFNDYQCPACGQSYLQYKPILAKYEATSPGLVKVVTQDYPLNPSCNANLTTMIHPAACDAAVAVRLAKQHNRGEAMEEWLYTHQTGMTSPLVRQAARDVGQVTDFEEKYASTLEAVKADVALGRQLRVQQTPTFFINGIKIEGAWAPQFFDQAIAYELQHAAK
jgi:uncharacterized membrane protein/protein-disulfide isomerase